MVDTIAVIEDELIERMSMNNAGRAFLLMEEGRKTEASIISTHAGGGGINTAIAFSRLGCSVETVAKLGVDSRARIIRDALTTEGVNARFISETSASGTGASVMISAHDRNAAVFTFRGANGLLNVADIDSVPFENDLVYIAGLSDRSADLFPDISARAARSGAVVVANPGIRQLAARGDDFHKALKSISLLSMNRDEAASQVPRLAAQRRKSSSRFVQITPSEMPELMRQGLSSAGFEMALPQYFDSMFSLGPDCLLITDGKSGAYAATREEIFFCPSLQIPVVGTAGAGDAFTSTFAFMYSEGAHPSEALRYATINAGSVVGYADTQTGLLRRPEIEAKYASSSQQLTVLSWKRS